MSKCLGVRVNANLQANPHIVLPFTIYRNIKKSESLIDPLFFISRLVGL
jgi:hypothetical protein